MANQKKKTHMGTEEQFELLHGLVTSEFIARVKGGEASTADLRAAVEWLKINNITGSSCRRQSVGRPYGSDSRTLV